ncbi:MAG TPA: PepSY domain-containing protein [Steroidobacteraceae bacterium]|nr:PepSY domain-containing protein [Steroidobacteraceae bacterium]
MARLILLLHRYLGIGVGVLMVMWCLSGVVMMYVSYPALAESARLKALEPIAWNGCCTIPEALRTTPEAAGGSTIEMLAGRPVLFLGTSQDGRPLDLLTGTRVENVTALQAIETARRFIAGAQAAPRMLGLIDHDQWTVSGDFKSQRPLYRYALGDAAGTELYVSSISGRAMQITTARERFWNWLGAVPHWLYFTELRRHAGLWSQIVIYTSLLGCFLAGIGIYLGVRQMAAQPAGRWSPYVGFNLWHHAAGLVFGLFALTWVLSGLLSMNPWGWLEGDGAQAEISRIQGAPAVPAARLAEALQSLVETHPIAVVLKAAPLNGRLYFVANSASGERQRLGADGAPAPLGPSDLDFLSGALQSGAAAPELMTQEDNFYFSHHQERVALPVYRTVLKSGTRYYLDAVSGTVAAKFDTQVRAYRWLHQGLHRLDFAAPLRVRPRWDVLMLLLMAGVTAVCVTGAVLGYRRVTRKAPAIRS